MTFIKINNVKSYNRSEESYNRWMTFTKISRWNHIIVKWIVQSIKSACQSFSGKLNQRIVTLNWNTDLSSNFATIALLQRQRKSNSYHSFWLARLSNSEIARLADNKFLARKRIHKNMRSTRWILSFQLALPSTMPRQASLPRTRS